jgi:rhodanese-related sulfurtransferase
MQHSAEFLKIVSDAKTRVREMNVQEVNEWLEKGTSFSLVDVREKSEWDRGRLPGAIHLSKGVIERDIVNTIPEKSRTIVLYCGGGYRSALAADSVQKMGYTNVISMDGGWRAWTDARYPTE